MSCDELNLHMGRLASWLRVGQLEGMSTQERERLERELEQVRRQYDQMGCKNHEVIFEPLPPWDPISWPELDDDDPFHF